MALIIPALLLAARPCVAQEQQGEWVQARGCAPLGSDDTLRRVADSALREAEAQAVQQVTGLSLADRTFVLNETTIQSFSAAMTRGVITDLEILDQGIEDEFQTTPDETPSYTYCVNVRAHVLFKEGLPDPDFTLTARLDREQYLNGEDARITVQATRAAYIAMYSVDESGALNIIYPNATTQIQKLEAGAVLEYPSEADRRNGVHLRVRLPEGSNNSVERIVVVATRDPIPQNEAAPGDLFALLKLLASRHAATWTDVALTYTVARSQDAGADINIMVNINTAAPAQLEALPGIGPAFAQKIVDYRNANGPFARIEEIQLVPGIGEKMFEKIKKYITVK